MLWCSTPKQYNPASDFAFPAEKKRKREIEEDIESATDGGKKKKAKTGKVHELAS